MYFSSSNNLAAFHFETVMARLDNLFGSPWLNVKFGKFELDNLLSEKRILTLTGIGGLRGRILDRLEEQHAWYDVASWIARAHLERGST